MRDKDANRDIRFYGSTTAGETGSTFTFDCNDLIAAFDKKGKLISSALLERPISISLSDDPIFWRESTANQVYDAWDGQWVSLYQNTYFFYKYNGVKYYGLWVNDSEQFLCVTASVRIDMHKQEQTNGCMFIVDPATPSVRQQGRSGQFRTSIHKRYSVRNQSQGKIIYRENAYDHDQVGDAQAAAARRGRLDLYPRAARRQLHCATAVLGPVVK